MREFRPIFHWNHKTKILNSSEFARIHTPKRASILGISLLYFARLKLLFLTYYQGVITHREKCNRRPTSDGSGKFIIFICDFVLSGSKTTKFARFSLCNLLVGWQFSFLMVTHKRIVINTEKQRDDYRWSGQNSPSWSYQEDRSRRLQVSANVTFPWFTLEAW